MAFKALIFDMDGTMVDNMHFHEEAWEVLHKKYGLPFDKPGFFAATAGATNLEIFARVFPDLSSEQWEVMAAEKEDLYAFAYAPHVQLLAGLTQLMAHADAANVPMAVATAAPPRNIAVVLDALEIRDRFVTVVSPSQGFRGKPHPDLFLEAARRMGVEPQDCLVFEDAPLGIEAARRAGMKAIAMLTMLRAEDFDGFENVIATAADFTVLNHDNLVAASAKIAS